MKKIQKIIAIIFLTGISCANNTAHAVVLGDHNKYTAEEIILNNTVGYVFSFLLIISVPMFIIGVYRDSKNKDKNKKFNMLFFVCSSLAYLYIVSVMSIIYSGLFFKYIYYFYPYYFTYIGIFIYYLPIYFFAKISAKILDADFLVVLSLFIFLFTISTFNATI